MSLVSCSCLALMWISVWCPLQALRLKGTTAKGQYPPAVLSENEYELSMLELGAPVTTFDPNGRSGTMVITRPSTGGKIYSGSAKRFSLGKYHRDYLAKIGSCATPVFTKKGDGRMCSVGRFSSGGSCSRVSSSRVSGEHSRLAKLMPTSSRGVGLEFEFVARSQHRSVDGAKRCFYQADASLPKRNRGKWNWGRDGSVKPLTRSEAQSLGAGSGETSGVGFEVTSPGPPNVLAGSTGFRAAIDVLTVLKSIGIQAGPTCGLHVHVNVRGRGGGSKLTFKQVAYVWAAYARWQFSINEMLSPSRVPNRYAQSLFLSGGTNRRIFENLHSWVRRGRDGSDKSFCNHLLGSGKCDRGKPQERYTQVNVHPISTFGTLEFRGHSATHDTERVMRWVQFCVAFVERFGKAGGSATGMSKFFASSSSSSDYFKLQKAQRTSTMKALYTQIQRGRSGQARKWRQTDFLSYYGHGSSGTRKWERNDRHCRSGGAATVRATCGNGGGGGGGGRPGGPGGPGPGFPFFPFQTGAASIDEEFVSDWPQAYMITERNGTRHMRAKVPVGQKSDSYLEIQMPEGDVVAELVDDDAINKGYVEFIAELYKP